MTASTIAKNRKRAKAWYHANKERAKKRIWRWQKENPGKVIKSRIRNRPKRLRAKRQYYQKRRSYLYSKSRSWAAAHPEKIRESSRKWAFKQLGYSIEKFNSAIIKQKKKCAICNKKFSKRRGPCVDHCHHILKVRGLLCRNCNLGLGFYRDSIFNLKRAILYLRRH